MSYHSTLLEAAYRQVELSRWSLERLHSKAKATITAGTAALSVTTVGLAGFASLLAGTGLGHEALLGSLFGKHSTWMAGVAMLGIGAVIASVVASVAALRSCPLHQILTSGEFELVSRGESSKMSEGDLGERLLRNAHASIRSFEECNDRVAPMVRRGQWLLVAGTGLISTIPLAAFFGLVAS